MFSSLGQLGEGLRATRSVPELVPGISGVPDRKPEPIPAAAPSGYRVDDEVRVYLADVAKLLPKPTELTSGLWNFFGTPARKSTFAKSVSKTFRSSIRT